MPGRSTTLRLVRSTTTRVVPGLGWLVPVLAFVLPVVGCGGGGSGDEAVSESLALAARLPSDGALNVGIVDVDAVRESLGFDPGTTPPTASPDDDLRFFKETGPALGILQGGNVPSPVVKAALAEAQVVASVTGDTAATAISSSSDPASFEDVMTSSGMQEEDGAFVPDDGSFAMAVGDGLIGIAETPGDASAIIDDTSTEVPEPLDQIDGDGELITLARFGASCLDSVTTSDSLGKEGEVAFFTIAEPDPTRIETTETLPEEPTVRGESVRVKVAATKNPAQEPPAYGSLSNLSVSYDCEGE